MKNSNYIVKLIPIVLGVCGLAFFYWPRKKTLDQYFARHLDLSMRQGVSGEFYITNETLKKLKIKDQQTDGKISIYRFENESLNAELLNRNIIIFDGPEENHICGSCVPDLWAYTFIAETKDSDARWTVVKLPLFGGNFDEYFSEETTNFIFKKRMIYIIQKSNGSYQGESGGGLQVIRFIPKSGYANSIYSRSGADYKALLGERYYGPKRVYTENWVTTYEVRENEILVKLKTNIENCSEYNNINEIGALKKKLSNFNCAINFPDKLEDIVALEDF